MTSMPLVRQVVNRELTAEVRMKWIWEAQRVENRLERAGEVAESRDANQCDPAATE